jgi:hypothetical protein
MKKPAIIMFVLISILILSGCAIRTPGINGIVLDEETKQPVPEAWVSSMITIQYATVAGDVIQCVTVGQPHTRTDKDGKFVISSRKIKGATFPFEFGNDVKNFGVGASTADDRGGSISLTDALGKNKIDVTIYIKSEFTNTTESEYFTYLQSLYNYCLTGRFSVEVPAVEGGCDAWELNYAIKKHERYLEKYGNNSQHAGGVLSQLGYLLKKKGDYIKAIEAFKKNLDYDKKRNIRFRRYESENQIMEIEKLINKNSTK